MRHGRLLALAGAGLLLSGCAIASDTGTLTILGASSTRVLNEDFAQFSDIKLEIINAGSSTLVQQLVDGSPGDILITADRATMDQALAQGVVADSQAIATNSLVMVVPAANPGNIGSVDDLLGHTVVLCDPQVPCGAASESLIADNNIEVAPASLEHQVADVLGKVVSAEADAGWVYRTDAVAAGDDVEVIDLPGSEGHPTEVLIAVTTTASDEHAAQLLVETLASTGMAEVWAEHGWTPVN